ncbi:MAG: hypothetical protein E7278_02490 [Lachnospiraceae bacterium]|nr:hypothetical protein [Lachnospiraceae bacterium]
MEEKKNTHRLLSILGMIGFGVIMTLGLLAFLVDRWLFHTWSELSFEEILFHLKSSIEGTNPEMVVHALLFYALPGILVLVALFVGLYFLRNYKKVRIIYVVTAMALSVGMMLFTVMDMQERIRLIDHLRAETSASDDSSISRILEEQYVDPATVAITFPEKKRNLIYIFLESMESTYADKASGGAFEKNVIPELTKLGQENENFSGDSDELDGALALPGATWTMGGLFAQSSGAPLKISLSTNSMELADSFFPGMTTMGDILAKEGYHQVLAIGSDATFGGRRTYFSTHGDYEIHDYNDALAKGRIPADYRVWWGMEDEKLFALAKEDLKELASAEEPFNYTMLTVDTHFEDGYQCHLCKDEFGDNVYANTMACSSRQVASFVEWCKEQDFYENTTIVLCGDHLTMDTDFCEDVSKDYQRKTYSVIINGASDEESTWTEPRAYSTMDMFPTTLSALGVEIDGNQLGLGVNLYSDKPTLVELYGLDTCIEALELSSNFLAIQYGGILSESTLNTSRQNSMLTPVFEQRGKNKYHIYFYFTGINNSYGWLNFQNVHAKLSVYDPSSQKTWEEELIGTENAGEALCEMDVETTNIRQLECSMSVYENPEKVFDFCSFTVGDRIVNVILSKNHKRMDYYYHPFEDTFEKVEYCIWEEGEGIEGIPEDAIHYDGEHVEDGLWKATVDISSFDAEDVVAGYILAGPAEGELEGQDKMNLHLGKHPFLR